MNFLYFLGMGEVRRSLERLQTKTDRILNKMEKLMAKIDDLQAAVGENHSAEDSVITLLRGIAQMLKDAQGDPAKLDEVVASIRASTDKLAAAVVENTPTETPPV